MQASDRIFKEIVGGIYDAVLDPGRWHQALDRMRTAFAFENCVLGIVAMPHGTSVLQVAVNVPDEYLRRVPAYNDEVLKLWGGPKRIAKVPLEEPVVQSHMTDPATWMQNAYFREWGCPQGLVDAVALALASDSTMVANLAFGKHKGARPVTPEDLDGLRLLGPHVRRAVTIGRLLEMETNRAETLEAALDSSANGAVLVNSNMTIVHANRAAEDMLAEGDPIRSVAGRLELESELVPGQLEAAVGQAAGREAELGRGGIGIPSRRQDGSPLVVNVMPLEQRSARVSRRQRPAAAVFVSKRPAGTSPLEDAAGLLFGLTPAEARIFELVRAGHSDQEIKEALGIAASTLKTHVLRLYDKTGRHRRADLAQLASEMDAVT